MNNNEIKNERNNNKWNQFLVGKNLKINSQWVGVKDDGFAENIYNIL